jgi:methionyl aminopeptidase
MSKLTRHFLRRKPKPAASRQKRSEPILKTPQEIQIMRESGRIVARVHAALREAIVPGVSTYDLDQVAASVLQKYGAKSSFLGYRGYPAHICTSVNEELVHGIPSKSRILREGDIISIDVGSYYRGFVGDSGWTYAVGAISEEAEYLMEITERSLYAGIAQAIVGNRIKDISAAVQKTIEMNGLYVVKEYTGHGVGRQMHEAPQVLNYVAGDADGNLEIQPGLVIALEPMVQVGTWQTETLKDKWTVISKDHSLTAHFEHTIAITNKGPEILTLP